MGLYQQWLRYQDVERSLHKTRQTLEEELAQLEGRLDTLFFEQLAQRELPLRDNPIFSALLTALDTSHRLVAEQPSVAHTLALASTWEYSYQLENEPISEDASILDRLQTVFAALRPEEVEQFYAVYKQCLLQGRITEVRQRLTALLEQLDVNELRTQLYQPSPIALASLARLQANGVSDSELLDQMLERGESWLDVTMQRLDYCEQLEDFLSDDYTQWCYRALDGAFDWMDPIREASIAKSAAADVPVVQQEEPTPGLAETEVMLLQKLATESYGDEVNGLDTAEVIEEGAMARLDAPGEADDTAETDSSTCDEEAQQQGEAPFDSAASSKKQGAVRRLVGRLWGQ